MADNRTRPAVEAALERLLETIKTPRALVLHAQDRLVLEQAVERVCAQLLGSPEPVLTVVLAGGTGAGKSSLINALAGAAIAETGPLRPTTTKPCVYHHRDVAPGSLPVALTAEAIFVPHNHAPLRSKVIVDTPDLDSFVAHHRATTRALLKAAGLVLYVFTPQNYRDERTWAVLREEKRFSACAAVLNKADLVMPVELEAITEDLHQAFAHLGLPEVRMFRTVATAHGSGDTDAARVPTVGADDLAALRAFMEQELQTSDVARLLQRQQVRVVSHLQTEIERVAPLRLLEQLDDATWDISDRLDRAAPRLSGALADHMMLAQAELVRRITMRQHERFQGPLRTWLAVADVLRFGLPRLVRRYAYHTPPGEAISGEAISGEPLIARQRSTAADLLRDEARALQSLLYARGLPIDRWRTITGQADGNRLLVEVAATLEAHVEAAAAASAGGGGAVVWVLSTVGRLVPAAFILIGLYVTGRDLLAGDYLGLPLLGHLLAMLVLTFLALQGLASLFLPAGRRWHGPDIGRQAICEVLTRTVTDWISAYRSDLEADLADLRGPLAELQSTLALGPAPDRSTPGESLP
jgi:energy-coupling factor transporter ATP-binding protein EcfA2